MIRAFCWRKGNMKIRNWTFAIALFSVLNMILGVGCSPIISQKTLTQNTEINAVSANNLIAKNIGNQNFVILDVRPAADYTSRHIAGAIDINYDSTNFKKDISKLIKKKQYLIYCATGVNGAAATQMM